MSSMRNAVQRRNHKERAQPLEREKWGILEKHKVSPLVNEKCCNCIDNQRYRTILSALAIIMRKKPGFGYCAKKRRRRIPMNSTLE